ncbi:AAA family ATPase [Actinomadura xylanilytica]|uniref:AAA family ATPase n=1 Tax=Actinomadura xylanilytica TaxID=887459 RepID=UPI00255AEC83|nr:AAA family ATPase [Actinomadura xylanilytica]MDL4770701.1 AAA family ATPase [Actinomadura xylanilytica]
MSIRDCTVIAVEGTHATGKTTLVHALTSHYRERGIHVTCTGEPARISPFMEEIVLHHVGTFDVVAELDALGAQLTAQLRAARHHHLLICDKTLINVVAYARMLLPPKDRDVLEAMTNLCRATSHLYDAVFYPVDTFNPRQHGDRFRDKVADQQDELDELLRAELKAAGLNPIVIPPGRKTAARVEWISARLATEGLISTLT